MEYNAWSMHLLHTTSCQLHEDRQVCVVVAVSRFARALSLVRGIAPSARTSQNFQANPLSN
jgi:hypothetical protein